MEALSKYINRYLLLSTAYGFVRKVGDLVDARIVVREWNEDASQHFDRPIPMLMMDRISALAISTAASPWLFPVYLHKDLTGLEIKMRRANPNDYGYGRPKRSWIEYLF